MCLQQTLPLYLILCVWVPKDGRLTSKSIDNSFSGCILCRVESDKLRERINHDENVIVVLAGLLYWSYMINMICFQRLLIFVNGC